MGTRNPETRHHQHLMGSQREVYVCAILQVACAVLLAEGVTVGVMSTDCSASIRPE
jgi:hypothetical protein